MTTEDQDALVGRLVRERHELRTRHQALLARIGELSAFLAAIASAMTTWHRAAVESRARLLIESNGIHVRDITRQRTIAGKLPDTAELQALQSDLADVEGQLAALNDRLKAFGA